MGVTDDELLREFHQLSQGARELVQDYGAKAGVSIPTPPGAVSWTVCGRSVEGSFFSWHARTFT